jgi:hypothetical protein
VWFQYNEPCQCFQVGSSGCSAAQKRSLTYFGAKNPILIAVQSCLAGYWQHSVSNPLLPPPHFLVQISSKQFGRKNVSSGQLPSSESVIIQPGSTLSSGNLCNITELL